MKRLNIKEIQNLIGRKIIKENATLDGKQAYRIEGSAAIYTKAMLETKALDEPGYSELI